MDNIPCIMLRVPRNMLTGHFKHLHKTQTLIGQGKLSEVVLNYYGEFYLQLREKVIMMRFRGIGICIYLQRNRWLQYQLIHSGCLEVPVPCAVLLQKQIIA